jgi:hypothetical protein
LANFKAQLSKARTLKQALAIYADSSVNNRHQVAMQSIIYIPQNILIDFLIFLIADLRKLEKDINVQLNDLDLSDGCFSSEEKFFLFTVLKIF